MKKIIIKIVSFVLLLSTALSVLIIPASADTPSYPDGGTVVTHDHLGSEKRATFYFRRSSDGKLLKTFIMYGPAGDYYVDGLTMWGYTPYEQDFPWHLMVSAEITNFSDNCLHKGQAFYTQIGVEFTQILSPDTYEGTVWLDPDTCDITKRHILIGADGSETLYDSNTLNYTYETLLLATSQSIAGYDLVSGYESRIYDNFTWDLVGASLNIPEKNYEAKFHSATFSSDGVDWCYYYDRTLNIDFKYQIKSYTINYYANGGTGAPDSQTKYYGTNLKLSTEIPTREGYVFAGWSYTPDDDTVEYYPGETYKTDSNMNLYALWQHGGYEIRYNANGGTGAPATQYKKQGEILTLRSTKPTREGYTFKGWATTPGPIQAVKYTPGGQYWLDESATLYAVWSENETSSYTVKFDANGGNGAPTSQTKTKGVDLTLTTKTPSRSGYTFAGWGTSANATSPTYYPGGKYTANASITLYAVWVKSSENYIISYDANGGIGAPATQTKSANVSITLSSTQPTRSGYKFLGWGTSSDTTTVSYNPGDTYSQDASITLYAVWRKDNYDISVSNLTVSPNTVEEYSDTSVSVRVDSWDQNRSYSNIPVQLLYNGSVIATKYINLPVYGVATVNFTLNVGKTAGDNTITARVNWSDRHNETDPNDNSVSTTVNVTPYEYDLYISSVTPNAKYREGTDVITSFMIYNDSERDILPENENTVYFTAYSYNSSGAKKTIVSQTWNQAVIPSKNSNLVYFKWTVPDGLAGKTVYMTCTVNSNGSVHEQNSGDNTVILTQTVADKFESQPSDTSYEEKPEGYSSTSPPSASYGTATWNQWVYSNGELVLKQYGVGISTAKPMLSPSESVSSSEETTVGWVIKSGYPIKIDYNPVLKVLSGYNTPTMNSITKIQNVYATFPEYGYSADVGKAAVLVLNSGVFEFVPNKYSNTGESVHFIPVWMDNGGYVVSVYAGDVWTPAGMISATVSGSNMSIEGTMYDDFYVGD